MNLYHYKHAVSTSITQVCSNHKRWLNLWKIIIGILRKPFQLYRLCDAITVKKDNTKCVRMRQEDGHHPVTDPAPVF